MNLQTVFGYVSLIFFLSACGQFKGFGEKLSEASFAISSDSAGPLRCVATSQWYGNSIGSDYIEESGDATRCEARARGYAERVCGYDGSNTYSVYLEVYQNDVLIQSGSIGVNCDLPQMSFGYLDVEVSLPDGSPAANAVVVIGGGIGYTDSAGRIENWQIPFGNYYFRAYLLSYGVYATTGKIVIDKENESLSLSLSLVQDQTPTVPRVPETIPEVPGGGPQPETPASETPDPEPSGSGSATICIYYQDNPLAGVDINGLATTASNGCATIDANFGSYDLEFSYPGYGSVAARVDHNRNGNTFNFYY